jgi:hypothetical protein
MAASAGAPRPSFETPRKGAAPQDDGGGNTVIARSEATKQSSSSFAASGLLRFARKDANITSAPPRTA